MRSPSNMAISAPVIHQASGLCARYIDHNLFWSIAQYADPSLDNTPLKEFQAAGIDVHSLAGDPRFVDPAKLDFRVRAESPALKLGFKNFPMDSFGARKDDACQKQG